MARSLGGNCGGGGNGRDGKGGDGDELHSEGDVAVFGGWLGRVSCFGCYINVNIGWMLRSKAGCSPSFSILLADILETSYLAVATST